jgi:hypothetical protein
MFPATGKGEYAELLQAGLTIGCGWLSPSIYKYGKVLLSG